MNLELLERLIMTPGVAGREHRVRELIRAETQGLFDEVRVDPMGSLIGVRKPRPKKPAKAGNTEGKPLRVMLAAHMDQIGFVARHIDAAGLVRIQNMGGFDNRNLLARHVLVCPDLKDPAKDLVGVMNPGVKPSHILTDAERGKIPELTDFYVDLGLSGDEVKKRVKVGDMIVLRPAFDRVGHTVVGQAMDNRIAVWVAIEAIRATEHHDCEIHCAFTSQEEVGMRGAGTASYHIEPDVAISLDITLCCDTPGVPDDQRVSKMGDGVGLLVMDSTAISDLGLIEEFEAIARKKRIKHQRSILPRGGNDAATIQQKRAGRRVITLVSPARYVHTITEMCLVDDLKAHRDLLAAYLMQA